MRIAFDELNGHKFKLKPPSLLARKVKTELRQELQDWQEENNKALLDFSKENKEIMTRYYDLINSDELVQAILLAEEHNIPEASDWQEDVEFRASRWKKMASVAMKFDKEPKEEFWKSDEIEFGIIDLAFDFFTGVRQIPMNAI